LRLIARNQIGLGRAGELGALQAIRHGKPKQEAEVTLRQALASELTDDDLAASNGESQTMFDLTCLVTEIWPGIQRAKRGRLAALNRGLCRNIANRMQI
jgi:hypothetical protein